jgi:hypothetical protein
VIAEQDDIQPAATATATATATAASSDAAAGPASGSGASNSGSNSRTKLPCAFVKLLLGLPVSVLEHGSWKRSPAAATLFKQLLPCDTDLGEQHTVLTNTQRNISSVLRRK